MTMLVAHSAWGIVTPEICGARFRQGTSGESDGTGSGLSGGSVALVALRSHLSSAPWRDGRGLSLAQLVGLVEHLLLGRVECI